MPIRETRQDTISIAEDNGALIRALTGIMEKATSFVRQFDTQANILIGISSGFALLSFSMMQNKIAFKPFAVLGFFSVLSVFAGLYSVHPPRFMRKKRQQESLLYNKKIGGFPSHAEYGEELIKMFEDRNRFVQEYALEIYNLYKYYYRPKRQLFTISRNLLIVGIVLGIAVFAYSFIYAV